MQSRLSPALASCGRGLPMASDHDYQRAESIVAAYPALHPVLFPGHHRLVDAIARAIEQARTSARAEARREIGRAWDVLGTSCSYEEARKAADVLEACAVESREPTP